MRHAHAKVRESNLRWLLPLGSLAAGTALVLMIQAAVGQTADQAQVEVAKAQEYGEYITDADGRSLYLFMADSKGNSTCYDACAEAWPPLLTSNSPKAGPQTQEDLLGMIERRDGSTQVTYNGWPLYYFVKDQGSGQTTGQDVEGFGAEWYLVSPQGEPVHGESHSDAASTEQ